MLMRGLMWIWAGLGVGLLAGCGGSTGPDDLYVIEEQHPISVDTYVTTELVPVRPHASGLGVEERARVQTMVQRFKRNGSGALSIASPMGNGLEGAALAMVSDIGEQLEWAGIAISDVRFVTYEVTPETQDAPIILSYQQYQASVAPCGNWSEDVSINHANVNYPDFGCAMQTNIAAMVAHPRDLVQPQDFDARDAQRLDEVMKAYRSGEIIAAEREADIRLSDVGE